MFPRKNVGGGGSYSVLQCQHNKKIKILLLGGKKIKSKYVQRTISYHHQASYKNTLVHTSEGLDVHAPAVALSEGSQ